MLADSLADESSSSPDEITDETLAAPRPNMSSRRTMVAPVTASLSDAEPTKEPAESGTAPVTKAAEGPVDPAASGNTSANATSLADGSQQAPQDSVANQPPTPAPAKEIPLGTVPDELPWQESLRHTIRTLQRQVTSESLSDTERARVQAHLGLLNIVAEDPEKAMNAFQDLDDEELEFWRQTIMALDVLLAPNELPRRSHRVELATGHFREGVRALATLGPLQVRNLAFCTKVSGFGNFSEFESYTFRTGQQVLLYVEIEDFAVEEVESVTSKRSGNGFSTRRVTHEVAGDLTYETELHARYDILDANQRKVATKVLPVDKESCRNRRQDYYIPYLIYLPEQMTPGHYTLELSVEDKKGVGKVGFAAIDFEIEGR